MERWAKQCRVLYSKENEVIEAAQTRASKWRGGPSSVECSNQGRTRLLKQHRLGQADGEVGQAVSSALIKGERGYRSSTD
ncbi:hypothetical protein PoB_002227900 [Plakobranchus ocellatus]|uniref:Uncharacterized protein n=1 Tax=Plakobranchus ocellatus TaxID=259542 RepID=A0AAV3ZKC8_9GAST|nr:hypothetical protein PoB_002227900 [Plakobranchus ocellatus]